MMVSTIYKAAEGAGGRCLGCLLIKKGDWVFFPQGKKYGSQFENVTFAYVSTLLSLITVSKGVNAETYMYSVVDPEVNNLREGWHPFFTLRERGR